MTLVPVFVSNSGQGHTNAMEYTIERRELSLENDVEVPGRTCGHVRRGFAEEYNGTDGRSRYCMARRERSCAAMACNARQTSAGSAEPKGTNAEDPEDSDDVHFSCLAIDTGALHIFHFDATRRSISLRESYNLTERPAGSLARIRLVFRMVHTKRRALSFAWGAMDGIKAVPHTLQTSV
ncbi:hypothetical protein B0H14DRAFT_2599860 [Mycena olivaceomarginata]|nr:hypothetical protein B0H14DRAFT_2599860 [Mycena olivaceomarginata]